ncbi:uncharacterized protein LOC107304721 isoform X2 [Oryza brachyantha]|uniref:uncharacterized protein LOC107304721 isoform X2 n=1 Tax=Oryza brachyantha TaxID=4533 RepID=UPI001ADBFA3F|nr:uncharacterized protein LOC107304721 isoform X2 [Oryza brachyantha]
MATLHARAPLLPRAPPQACPAAHLATRRQPRLSVAVSAGGGVGVGGPELRTCKNCKKQYDPAANHPSACRYHTAHFGGETKRKFESVYAGGTLDTPDSGKVFQYWHCCGSEDPFDLGCAPDESFVCPK